MTQTANHSAPTSPPAAAHLVLGRFGETYAARHLVSAGMVLLERNWRGSCGEIDLILRERRTLVLCEVKTRTSQARGHAMEAVDSEKLSRLQALAEEWMDRRGVRPAEVRFDVVAVLVERGAVTDIEHVRGLS